jgi:hypothetical protein
MFLGAVGPIADELARAPLRVVCLDQAELASAVQHPRAVAQALWNGRACAVEWARVPGIGGGTDRL